MGLVEALLGGLAVPLHRHALVLGHAPAICVNYTEAGLGHAEVAWVKGQLQLNLRTGPGTQYRILGVVETGDRAEILERRDAWTQIRVGGLADGWIPVGFLQPEAPADVLLSQRTTENEELRARVKTLSSDTTALRDDNEQLSGSDQVQKDEIKRLTRENLELRAGARWPEWITGAGIVLVGMSLGALLSRSAGRRRQPRIRR